MNKNRIACTIAAALTLTIPASARLDHAAVHLEARVTSPAITVSITATIPATPSTTASSSRATGTTATSMHQGDRVRRLPRRTR